MAASAAGLAEIVLTSFHYTLTNLNLHIVFSGATAAPIKGRQPEFLVKISAKSGSLILK
jgi:hypothetical protein